MGTGHAPDSFSTRACADIWVNISPPRDCRLAAVRSRDPKKVFIHATAMASIPPASVPLAGAIVGRSEGSAYRAVCPASIPFSAVVSSPAGGPMSRISAHSTFAAALCAHNTTAHLRRVSYLRCKIAGRVEGHRCNYCFLPFF